MGQSPGDSLGCRRFAKTFPAGEFISEKRGCAIWIWMTCGSVAMWMFMWSFLHSSNSPLPTAAFPALCEVGETENHEALELFTSLH